jgi:CelD/BcsL family acetyltransferase involved in cellulose biosynthesis
VTRVTALTAFAPSGALDIERAAPTHARVAACDQPPGLDLHIYGDFAAVKTEWRAFERSAECTVFQAFDWLATWQRNVGARRGVQPAIVVGRFGDGETAIILPLAMAPARMLRRLCWLGEGLCDYHAPLLARGFAQRVPRDHFLALWAELAERLARDPLYRHDWIELEKMPEMIGTEPNPLVYLPVIANASGAYRMALGANWEEFYYDKRSSATRRRDRTKRKHMSQFGEVRFVTAANADDVRRTVEALMAQKTRSLRRRGIPDMFAPPGHREFFLELVGNAQIRDLVHVSRVEIGAAYAAINLGAVFGDCYYHFLACYDEESGFARFGPGVLHLRELIAYAIGRGLKHFDFTIGDEPYKREWADTELKLYDYVAATNARGVVAARISIVRRRVKRFLKQTPWAWRTVSRFRAALGSLWERNSTKRV